MKVIGFIEDRPINKVAYLSDSWLLYYENGDNEDDIRAANYNSYGKFFNLDSGDEIKISNLLNFEIVNDANIIIFNSKDKVSDFDLAVQYRVFQNLLNDDQENDSSLRN